MTLALLVVCPVCNAPVGSVCRTKTGRSMPPHQARIRRAEADS